MNRNFCLFSMVFIFYGNVFNQAVAPSLADQIVGKCVRIKSNKYDRYFSIRWLNDGAGLGRYRLRADTTATDDPGTMFYVDRSGDFLGFRSTVANSFTMKCCAVTECIYQIKFEGINFDTLEQWTLEGDSLKNCYLKSKATNSYFCTQEEPSNGLPETVAATQRKAWVPSGKEYDGAKLSIEIVDRPTFKKYVRFWSTKYQKYFVVMPIPDARGGSFWRLNAVGDNKYHPSAKFEILPVGDSYYLNSNVANGFTLTSCNVVSCLNQVRLENKNRGPAEQWFIEGGVYKPGEDVIRNCYLHSNNGQNSYLCTPASFQGLPETVAWTQKAELKPATLYQEYIKGTAKGSSNWVYDPENKDVMNLNVEIVPDRPQGCEPYTYVNEAKQKVVLTADYIDVVNANNIWAKNGTDLFYFESDDKWSKVPNFPAIQFSVSRCFPLNEALIWGFEKGFAARRYILGKSGASLVLKETKEVPGVLKSVSLLQDSFVWGVGPDSKPYNWNAYTKAWGVVNGSLEQISVGSDGEVWGVNSTGSVLRWTGLVWEEKAKLLKQVAVGSKDNIWGVGIHNELAKWNNETKIFEFINDGVEQVAVGSDGSVFAIGCDKTVYRVK